MREILKKHHKLVVGALIIMIYFTLLTLMSFLRSTTIKATGEDLVTFQDFRAEGPEVGKVWINGDGMHIRDENSGDKVFLGAISLRDVQMLQVQFAVECPENFAGEATLHVDLQAYGYDSDEQEFTVSLHGGRNEVSGIIDKGGSAPNEAYFRVFCLDAVQCDITDLSVRRAEETMHSGMGACVAVAVVLSMLLLAVILTERKQNADMKIEGKTCNGELRVKLLFIGVALIYLLHIVSAIICKRFYYADGGFFLADLINNQNNMLPLSNDSSVLRISANILNQLPAIICLKLGISNIAVLSFVFGVPLFFNTIIGLLLCWRKCRQIENGKTLFLFPIAAYAFFCIPSDIFVINPAFTAYWIYFILLFHIIADNSKLMDKLLLAFLLVVSSCAHESFLIIGPFLLVVIFLEFSRTHNKGKKIELCVSGTAIVAGIGINVFYIYTHTAVTGSLYFSSISTALQGGNLFRSNILISCFGLILVILGISRMLDRVWIWIGAFIAGIIYILAVRRDQNAYSPFTEYMCRALITVGMFGGILLAYAYYRLCDKPFMKKICIKNWWRVTAVVLMLQCVWQFGNTYAWDRYIVEFRSEIQTHRGIFETIGQDTPFAWGWNQGSISLLLSEDYHVESLMDDLDPACKPYIEDDALWVPFMWVNPSVYDISQLIEYEKQPESTIEDCKDVALYCSIESVRDESGVLTLPVCIQNNGEYILKNRDLFACYHIYGSNGLIIWDGVRTDVEQDILPGESIEINVLVQYGEQLPPGDYVIELALVKEYQYWFNDQGMLGPKVDLCYMPTEA